MNKFKVGDKVRRIGTECGGMKTGDVGTVKAVLFRYDMKLMEYAGLHSMSSFELVEEGNLTPHVHCEAIKAWADGHTIQHTTANIEGWEDVLYPNWSTSVLYRIKPYNPNQAKIEELRRKLDELRQHHLNLFQELEDLERQQL